MVKISWIIYISKNSKESLIANKFSFHINDCFLNNSWSYFAIYSSTQNYTRTLKLIQALSSLGGMDKIYLQKILSGAIF